MPVCSSMSARPVALSCGPTIETAACSVRSAALSAHPYNFRRVAVADQCCHPMAPDNSLKPKLLRSSA